MSDKCDTPLPHQLVQTCPPSVITEDKCAVIGCEYKTVKVTTTTTADCVKTVVIMDGVIILPPDTKIFACKEPTPVIPACSTVIAPVPFTVTGVDCAGLPVAATGLPEQLIQTVPHPTAVQLVKFCNPAVELDRDFATLCAPDGTKVLVATAWDKASPLATAPTIEAYTLAGTPYAGDRSLLTDCGAEKLDIVAEEYCSSGLQYERISFYDVSTLPPTLAATLWRDSSGASVAAPAAGTVGACKAQTSIDRPICSNTTAGEFWNMVERTSTNAAGVVTVNYFDPDTSPMLDVTALFASIRHGGACDCCNEKPCVFEKYYESLSPTATLMAVYGTDFRDTLGFVNAFTGALVTAGTVPGANLNALGLDKSTNNAVFIDRITGNIYTAYSPNYAITLASVMQPGTVDFNNTILGALDSSQTWWVGGISDPDDNVATITVAKVNPATGVQTPVPSLTAILNSGAYGFDFDFSPSDDLYVLMGLNIYVSTKVTNYAGWASVGTLTGITSTAGSMAYDVGILRGVSDGQLWAYDLSTGLTTITTTLPPEISFADMAGAVDPVCKQVFRNSCTGVFYELDQIMVYTPVTTPIKGECA